MLLVAARTSLETQNAASHFLHYIHGVNPLGLVYLSNMGEYGAERSVSTLYHAWFEDSSPVWDEVTANTAGPAPGFLVGGPNPSYSPDGCCPNSCFAEIFNQQCVIAAQLSPAQQPPLKTYREFNNDWPMNSWELTENSNSYQVAYIRLLSSLLGAQQR